MMFLAICKYIPKALLSIAGELFVWVFSWFIALFYFKAEETVVTGYPSQFPGKLREHISIPFRWATTFDDCADAQFYSGRMPNVTQEQYDNSAWLRYKARVLWLCRNPAYGLGNSLGFIQNGLKETIVKDENHLWDKGYANTSIKTFTNVFGQKGFLYEKQIHLGG